MTKNQRKSRDKAAVESPANDGVGREGKGRDEGEPERVLKGKRKKKGGKSEEEVKEEGRKGTEDEVAEREVKRVSEKGVSGGKMKKGREDMTKEDGPKAIASSFEGRNVEEDDARKSSKKQRERKKEGGEEGGDKKVGEESGLSRKQKQRSGDEKMENVRPSNGSVRQSDPSVVLSLSRSMQKSRSDSPNKKNNEKAEASRKNPSQQKSESKKRKSSEGGIRDVSVPASSIEEEPQEGAKKAEKDNDHGPKKKRTSGEKANDNGPKSCSLPLSRVRNIMRSNNLNLKVTQECYFLICKATVYNCPILGQFSVFNLILL